MKVVCPKSPRVVQILPYKPKFPITPSRYPGLTVVKETECRAIIV